MIKATPEQIEAAWKVMCNSLLILKRSDVEAAINAALNVAPVGDIRATARKLAEQIEEEWAPDWVGTGNSRSGALDRKLGLEAATDLIAAALSAAPPSTVPVAREALMEAEKALTPFGTIIGRKLADNITDSYARNYSLGITVGEFRAVQAALAKIKSALAATDNPTAEEE